MSRATSSKNCALCHWIICFDLACLSFEIVRRNYYEEINVFECVMMMMLKNNNILTCVVARR